MTSVQKMLSNLSRKEGCLGGALQTAPIAANDVPSHLALTRGVAEALELLSKHLLPYLIANYHKIAYT